MDSVNKIMPYIIYIYIYIYMCIINYTNNNKLSKYKSKAKRVYSEKLREKQLFIYVIKMISIDAWGA